MIIIYLFKNYQNNLQGFGFYFIRCALYIPTYIVGNKQKLKAIEYNNLYLKNHPGPYLLTLKSTPKIIIYATNNPIVDNIAVY